MLGGFVEWLAEELVWVDVKRDYRLMKIYSFYTVKEAERDSRAGWRSVIKDMQDEYGWIGDFIVYPYRVRSRDKWGYTIVRYGVYVGMVVPDSVAGVLLDRLRGRLGRDSFKRDVRVTEFTDGWKLVVVRLEDTCDPSYMDCREAERFGAGGQAKQVYRLYIDYLLSKATESKNPETGEPLFPPTPVLVVKPDTVRAEVARQAQLVKELASSVWRLANTLRKTRYDKMFAPPVPLVILDGHEIKGLTREFSEMIAERLTKHGVEARVLGQGFHALPRLDGVPNTLVSSIMLEELRRSASTMGIYVEPFTLYAEAAGAHYIHADVFILSSGQAEKVAERVAKRLVNLAKTGQVADFWNKPEPVRRAMHDVAFTVLSETGGRYETVEELGSDTGAHYYAGQAAVRIVSRGKSPSDLHTVVHEVVHHLDWVLGGGSWFSEKLDTEDPRFREEAYKLLAAFKLETDLRHSHDPVELFAEAFELFVLYPNTVRKVSPYMYRLMRDVFRRLPPETRRVLREVSLGSYETAQKALKALEERGLLRDLPWELRKAAGKPVGQLTEEEKHMLLRWALVKYGARFLRDISRRAKRRPRYTYTWIKAPNRADIPGVDTPETKPTYKKMLEKRKKALRAG